MKQEMHMVTDYAVRPAGKPDECFYCNAKLGTEHNLGCVIREQSAVVRFSLDLVVKKPEDWTPEQIENYYNKGSWCADNLFTTLEDLSKAQGCLCHAVKAEYVRDATADDENSQHVWVGQYTD